VTWADYRFAESARVASSEIRNRYSNRNIWFTGHWGFHYYMQNLGAKPLDVSRPGPLSGDIFIVPDGNTNVLRPPPDYAQLLEIIQVPSGIPLRTMSKKVGAGFYSDMYGPLPFAVGPVPLHQYIVLEMKRPWVFDDGS
jgi:hypothetical protein